MSLDSAGGAAAAFDPPGDGGLRDRQGGDGARGGKGAPLLGEILGKGLAMPAQRVYNATDRVTRLIALIIGNLQRHRRVGPMPRTGRRARLRAWFL